MMDISLLQELGLSPNEAKLYYALLTYGGSGVSTVSVRANVHRRNAYDALQRLSEKGLVSEVHGYGETRYEAVEPGKLQELIVEKELKLAKVLPDMQKMFQEHRAAELAYIYKGVEGVKNYMREALKVGKDMYILGAEGVWLDPRIRTYTSWFLREAAHKKMKLYTLFDHDALDMPEMLNLLSHEYKILPEEYATHSTMDIFGDYVVTYTGTQPGQLLENSTIFVMYSPDLAESYRTWWKMIWDLLPAASKKNRVRTSDTEPRKRIAKEK